MLEEYRDIQGSEGLQSRHRKVKGQIEASEFSCLLSLFVFNKRNSLKKVWESPCCQSITFFLSLSLSPLLSCLCAIRRAIVIPCSAPKATGGISLRSCPFGSFPHPHFRKLFIRIPWKPLCILYTLLQKKKKRREKEWKWGREPLHVWLCPLIIRLSLKQMVVHCAVYVNTCPFERAVPCLRNASLETNESQIIGNKGVSLDMLTKHFAPREPLGCYFEA